MAILQDFYFLCYAQIRILCFVWKQDESLYPLPVDVNPALRVNSNLLKNLSEAVRNSIIYQHNNGLAEGSVNKIKLIKRTMYGRNSFEMLRAKVLFHEQFHCEFN